MCATNFVRLLYGFGIKIGHDCDGYYLMYTFEKISNDS